MWIYYASSFPFLLIITFGWCCDTGDRAALLAFSNELESPLWPGGNGSVSDCCRWAGVTCSNGSSIPYTGRIVALDLTNMTLRGPLSSSLGRLSHLRRLELPLNRLSGPIPEELYGLPSIEVINLSYNSLSGPLSWAIGNLSSLVIFMAGVNNLSGVIPDAFHGLKNLQTFSLNDNNLRGPLPVSLSYCSNLKYLDLGGNNMRGSVGVNFTSTPKLEALILQNNHFTGNIPNGISSCTRLQVLDFRGNELLGHISWGTFPSSLRFVLLSDNHLSNITRTLLSLQKCSNLSALTLNGNFRKEEMPTDGIYGFPNLRYLTIRDSELSGIIPMWLSRSDQLVQLDLSGNYLKGQIPMFLTRLRSLNSNGQNGYIMIPVVLETFNLSFAMKPAFDLSNNLLTGNTWMHISNLRQIVVLDLSNNSLSGTIPDDFSKMKNLEYLDLSSNQISGTIPSSLNRLNYLSFFCVANNRLHGDVPTGSQFSTFPSKCFDGNTGLCYVGKPGCYSLAPFAIKPNEQEEESYKVINMGIPFVVGVSVGYIAAFLVVGIYHGWTNIKRPSIYKRTR